MTPGQDQHVVIREWTAEDFADVRRIMWDTWLATYASFIPEADLKSYFDSAYSLDALGKMFRTPDIHGFIAEIDGVRVACQRTHYNRAEGRFYVQSLYVLPSCQGRGLGTLLMEAAEACARGYGVNAVWLGVMVHNSGALAWYRKMGFDFVEKMPFTIGRTTVDHLIGFMRIDSAKGTESQAGSEARPAPKSNRRKK
jgi:ribosomal protein S18 acetylase RimI-like enzyme